MERDLSLPYGSVADVSFPAVVHERFTQRVRTTFADGVEVSDPAALASGGIDPAAVAVPRGRLSLPSAGAGGTPALPGLELYTNPCTILP